MPEPAVFMPASAEIYMLCLVCGAPRTAFRQVMDDLTIRWGMTCSADWSHGPDRPAHLDGQRGGDDGAR